MKPPGVTNKHIAYLFQCGYSILGLAKKYRCQEWEIQAAIRQYVTPGGR